MASQAALTAETVAGLRRATGRDQYCELPEQNIQVFANSYGIF